MIKAASSSRPPSLSLLLVTLLLPLSSLAFLRRPPPVDDTAAPASPSPAGERVQRLGYRGGNHNLLQEQGDSPSPSSESHPPCGALTRAPQEVHYDLTVAHNTLYPDGYAMSGDFFNVGESYLGPLMEMMEGDLLTVNVTNLGKADQATHWHGLDSQDFPFNDGAVGYSVGAMPVSTSYQYTFHAKPAGFSWYHGHMEEVLQGGNRGLFMIHKQTCNNPHASRYTVESYLAISEALPWYLNDDKTKALRHATAEEDRENFFLGKHFEYEGIVTDAGQGPTSEMPWAGMLVNGVGRGIPLNYSSEYKSGKSDVWGEAKGEYYQHHVQKGGER